MNLIHSIDDKCYIGQNYYFSMKKILFRKLLIDCLKFFIISLLSTSIIVWVFQAVNYLDIMIEDGRSHVVYINYTLLNFPKIISRILPFALFFSFSYILARSEIENELVVFWTIGIAKIEIINFFLKFSLIIIVIQIFLTSFLVPKSQEIARTIIKSSNIDFIESHIKPKRFNDTIKNLTIYTDLKDENNNLVNIYIKKGGEENYQITFAKKGKFSIKNGNKILVLYDGETIQGSGDKITNFKFSESDFSMSNLDTNSITSYKTQETSTIELFKCIENYLSGNLNINNHNSITLNCNLNNIHNVYKEIYKRNIIPLYIPILILISLIHIMISKENINFTKFRVILFIIGLSLIILSESSLSLINSIHYSNLRMSIIPILIFIIIYLWIQKKLSHKKINI